MTPDEVLVLAEVRRLCRNGGALAARLKADLSQTEVAAAVGVSVPTVSRWERGMRSPRGVAAVTYGRLLRRLQIA